MTTKHAKLNRTWDRCRSQGATVRNPASCRRGGAATYRHPSVIRGRTCCHMGREINRRVKPLGQWLVENMPARDRA